jgi:hypothetical protein
LHDNVKGHSFSKKTGLAMITYEKLKETPHHFECLTGISVSEFDRLLQKMEPLWQQINYQRLDRPNRLRSVGGGPDYKLDLPDRVLMTVMLLHLCPNTDTLGSFFNVDKSTVSRNTRNILPVLHQAANGSNRWTQPPQRGRGKCVEEILRQHPDLKEFFREEVFQ